MYSVCPKLYVQCHLPILLDFKSALYTYESNYENNLLQLEPSVSTKPATCKSTECSLLPGADPGYTIRGVHYGMKSYCVKQ